MPTYQYRCVECDRDLEAVQSFTDEPLTQCPSCGGRLRKLFGSVGVVFKGSGFYRNDARADARSASEAKAEGGAKVKESADAKSGSAADSTSGSGAKAGDGAAPAAAKKSEAGSGSKSGDGGSRSGSKSVGNRERGSGSSAA